MPYTRYISLNENLKDPRDTIFFLKTEPLEIPCLKLKIYIAKYESKYAWERSPKGFFRRLGEALKKAFKTFRDEI